MGLGTSEQEADSPASFSLVRGRKLLGFAVPIARSGIFGPIFVYQYIPNLMMCEDRW